MLEKVHRIQDAGMEVWCGMIMGFDNDDASVFDAQRRFTEQSRRSQTMSRCSPPSRRRRSRHKPAGKRSRRLDLF